MKTYTIIGGVNGVGKSSFTGVLKGRQANLGVIVDVDKITADLGGNMLHGAKAAIDKIKFCLQNQISFTQETTLSGIKTERTVQAAKEKGYWIRLFYIGLDSAEESLARIENRVQRGGHDIPAADVNRRFAQRWDALRRVLPLCDEVEFWDNYNGFSKIASFQHGELSIFVDWQPLWFAQMLQALADLFPESE